MKLKIEPAPQEEVSLPEQRKFDKRMTETLIGNLEALQSLPAEQQKTATRFLFAGPKTKELAMNSGILETDDAETIIRKLTQALEENEEERKRAERTFIPEEEVVPEESQEARETRARVMEVQEEINELYKINKKIIEEQDRLKEELVFLELFVTEKEEAPMDIRATQMRIEEYEREIQEILPEEKTGFFQSIFQKNDAQENESVLAARREDLEIKRMKAYESIQSKQRQIQAKEARFQTRLRELREVLGEPLEEELLPDSWRELAQQFRETLQKVHERLDEDFEERKKEIEELEAQRDAVENFKNVA